MVKTYNPIYRVSGVAEVLRTNRNAVYNLMNNEPFPYLVLNGATPGGGGALKKLIESYPTESVGGEEK